MALLACMEGEVLESRAVRPHRHTHADRAASWRRQTSCVGAHADPAVVGFNMTPEIMDLLEREMNDRPLFHVLAGDRATHTLWLGTRMEELARAFQQVREGLLLEGHHRAAARGTGDDMLAMLVPMEHVVGRASIACIGAGRAEALLSAAGAVRVADAAVAAPTAGRALACMADPGGRGVSWISFKVPERFEEAAHQVEAWAGGASWKPGSTVDREAIEARIRVGQAGCVILLADPDPSEWQGLSAHGRLLPEASTWFEPRFRSGLCMAELERAVTTISR